MTRVTSEAHSASCRGSPSSTTLRLVCTFFDCSRCSLPKLVPQRRLASMPQHTSRVTPWLAARCDCCRKLASKRKRNWWLTQGSDWSRSEIFCRCTFFGLLEANISGLSYLARYNRPLKSLCPLLPRQKQVPHRHTTSRAKFGGRAGGGVITAGDRPNMNVAMSFGFAPRMQRLAPLPATTATGVLPSSTAHHPSCLCRGAAAQSQHVSSVITTHCNCHMVHERYKPRGRCARS